MFVEGGVAMAHRPGMNTLFSRLREGAGEGWSGWNEYAGCCVNAGDCGGDAGNTDFGIFRSVTPGEMGMFLPNF